MANYYHDNAQHIDHSRTIHIDGSVPNLDSLLRDFLRDEPAPQSAPQAAEEPSPSAPLSWQQILTDYAVPDEKCKKSYGSHNVRIAMYIKALEDVHLLNIAERQSDRALAFYQTLTDIFGYAIIQSSVEWQLNHFQENEKNKYTYETDILPLIKSLTEAA